MKINIVGGSGLMGRTLTPPLVKGGHDVSFSSARRITKKLEDAVKKSDLTIISVPIYVTERVIRAVAPYAKALMDFTSVKSYPNAWMLKYSKDDCEVGGLHPLFKDPPVKGKTMIYCPTERSGEKCDDIVESLKKSGIKLLEMNASDHDYIMALTQNARTILLETYGLLLGKTRMGIEEIDEMSPPPSKALLSIISRQVDETNDEMYRSMRKYNPWEEKLEFKLVDSLTEVFRNGNHQKKIRKFYNDKLAKYQERAQKLIDNA